jgi:hypothetical protein
MEERAPKEMIDMMHPAVMITLGAEYHLCRKAAVI